jgi:lipopolysaccharide transport system permease protein
MHTATATRVFRIQKTRGLRFLDLRELWTYRELVYFLVWRNFKVRYRQTAIGVLWAVIQPLGMMIAFTLIFGKLARIPSDGIPYPLFAYAGLLPWQVFASSWAGATNSLVADQQLVTRVYFPRMLVPIAITLVALVDCAIASVLLVGLMLIYGFVPDSAILWLPAFVLLMVTTSIGVGFWFSALNVEYRDVVQALPFLSQIWLTVTPVVYPSSLVPDSWHWLYSLNPMAGVVEGFRWALLGTGSAPSASLALSAATATALLVSGIIWFRWRERTFADALGSGGR